MVMTKVISKLSPNRRIPREELRARLYETALGLFRERGFDATRIDDIAARAGVAKGTLFNFFPSKAAILLRYYDEIDAKFGHALAALSPDDPKASLAGFYREAEALLRSEGPMIDAVFRELAADATLHDTDRASGARDVLVDFFRACKAKGTLAAHVEPAVAGHIAADLWSATVRDWLRAGKRYSLKLRLAAKLDAVFDGLGPAA